MRTLLITLIITLLVNCLMMNTAEARRFGGGHSVGVQRSASSFKRTTPMPTAPAPAPRSNSWLGPLAGLAIGGLLASMFFGHGLGGSIGWIILAVVGFMAFNWFRNRQNMRQSNFSNIFQNMANPNTAQNYAAPASQFSAASSNYPNDFNQEEFLHEAKASFIRMQAAYDVKNMNDLREFTTPQIFGEISVQLQERGDAKNVTEVITLNAELLDVSEEAQGTIATVQFTGLIREEENAAPNNLNEIWNFIKSQTGTWLVAGIQQSS